MATSGETFDRSFIAASLDGDSFSSEPLFHLQNSCPDSSAFSVYDKPLHLPGGTFDSTDMRNVGEKLGPVSRAAFLSSRETDQSPDIRYIFQNTREHVGSVLDHLNSCSSTLPLRQSDDRTNFVPSQDASYDARLRSRFNSDGARNFANCHQLPRAVPSGESAHHSTDSFMHSNCFQPPQSSSPVMTDEQKGILRDSNVNLPSFAVLDPLNRLPGCKGGVIGDRGHRFKKRASHVAVDTKVEDVFEPARGNQPFVLSEGLNCKSSTVLCGSMQTVPSVQGNNDCASEAAARRNCDPHHEDNYGFSTGSSEKSSIGNGHEATSVETGYFGNVFASDLENSSKSPPGNVDKTDSENARRESSCKSTRKKSEADKRPTKQEPFFDPRRIFATSSKQTPRKASSKSEKPVIKITESRPDLASDGNSMEFSSDRKTLTQVKAESVEENKDSVLNNKSPSQPHSGQSLDHHQFIRNDLSDDWKHKNTHASADAVRASQHPKIEQQESNDSSRIPETVQKHVTDDKPSCRKVENESTRNVEVREDRKIGNRLRKISSYLGRIGKGTIYNYLVWVLREISLLIFNIVKLLIGVILHEIFAIMHYICWMAWQGIKWFYAVLKSRSSRMNDEERNQWDQASRANYLRRNRFLLENINLPESGNEAIHRLLSCEGKDPYSILGLKVDCADEEIRKYYRRQAFLVHPDKNHEPGAEEAFKILNHAFEMIGEPEKRQNYDSQADVEQEDDAARQQFSDLLTKLHETMQEAMQYMGCSVCGGKHKRIPVDILAREARYCSQCDLRHSAKEGDVWAETSRFGFVWHYYACMEGDIYDITSWASCQSEKFRHVPANSHSVLIHISTGHNRQQRTAARDAEAEFKDLLNSMYSAAGRGGAAAAAAGGGPFGRGAYSSESTSAGTGSGSKRRRRRRR